MTVYDIGGWASPRGPKNYDVIFAQPLMWMLSFREGRKK